MCCSERHRRALITMAVGGLVLFNGDAHALDAGRYGTVYAIREPDWLEEIKRTVQAKVDSGDWARRQADVQKRATEQLTTPRPVAGISVATARRSWLHDPSIVLSTDVRDHGGRVVIAAGTRVNPLDVVALPQPLLFFDGRDARQVSAAQGLIAKHGGLVTPILIAGSWQRLGKAWQRSVYFDQQGRMVHQLGIRAVPALVTQEAVALRVEEFVP
jgi:conjugal transfer pilus assembly protein TraW